jgi:hypothetical protein
LTKPVNGGSGGWDVTVYVPTLTGGTFQDYPWDPSRRRVFSRANVPYLSYQSNLAKDFPNIPADNFALLATRTIAVNAGTYQFCIRSDDGSWLWVDGIQILNNGGLHVEGTFCKNIQLSAGNHNITVNYFEHEGSEILDVSVDDSYLPLQGNALAQSGCRVALK